MLITNQAILRRNAVLVFMVLLIVAGISSYMTIPREGAPDITIPYVFITAAYEGVAPAEIENLVVIPLERQLRDLENVKEMTSTSAEGVATIVIEFTPDEDINNALQRARDKISLARRDLPKDLDEPIVEAINFSTDMPVLIVTLSGAPETQRLKHLAEDLQDLIEDIPGVRQASIGGVREREIRVDVDLFRLTAQRLTMGALISRIAAENRTTSAGNIELAGDKLQVRVPGEYAIAGDLRDIVLETRGGAPIRLCDVAEVRDTFKDLDSISRVNGQPAVSLHIKKRSGENTVTLIRQVQQVIRDYNLPAPIKLTIIRDQSEIIHMMLEELENNIFSGVVLVFLVLMAFMGKRNSIFVAMAIPFSMLMSFVVLDMLGVTLNMIVLFSLVISVGMLVDNGIVIVENIFRNYGLGMSRTEAARRGASEVAWPVITSTLTTLVAFGPLLFWPGIMGQFMGFLPTTLIVTLTSSLLVALIFNPAVCSLFITRPALPAPDQAARKHPVIAFYERLLRATLAQRGRVILLGALAFILTFMAFGRFSRGVELFPSTDPRSFTISVKYPQGTRIEKTDTAMRRIEATLAGFDDIKFFLTTIGAGVSALEGGGGINAGAIRVEFPPANERARSSAVVMDEIRAALDAIPGAELKIEAEEEGPPTGAPVSIEIAGDDFDVLAELAGAVTRAIKGIPGLVDVQDNFEEALPELQFKVDRRRAALLGFDTASIGNFLRTALYGATASKFRAGEDEYDITVRFQESQRQSPDTLRQIFMPLPGGVRTVPLSTLGQAHYTGGHGVITHKNRKRVITITGELRGRGIKDVLDDVKSVVGALPRPRSYTIAYTGENREMDEAGAFLSKALIIAIGLIFVILVVQFNSAATPLVILVAVLLSMIGVMWGLLICNMRFSIIMTGLGVISLAGVVVNNAIVLIDCIRQRLDEGLPSDEAIVAAGRLRFRPVMLTAVTTILGLIPMAIGYSVDIHTWPWRIVAGAESSQWWAPMAIAIIFGLGVATMLTLIIVPAMFSLTHGLAQKVLRRRLEDATKD